MQLEVSDDGIWNDNPEEASTNVPVKYRGTQADRQDMRVMGRKQVLRRNFKGLTMLGFASMVMVAWEALLVYLPYPLYDGGQPIIFWGLFIAPICLSFVYLSLAELASMSPTAGGQYHWVSENAPPRYQKQLSYLVGWLIALGWQTWLTSTCFLAADVLQGLIALNMHDYAPKAWQGTLLVIAIIVFSALFNTVLASQLPTIEAALLVFHVVGLFAIVIPLWVMSPRGNVQSVIFDFTNVGGYSSKGLSGMIGLVTMFGILFGYDCTVHMAEEIQDASRVIPPTIIGGMWSNAILLIVVGITMVFSLGDVTEVMDSPIGYPFIQVFLNSTGSYAATNVMTAIVAITMVAACFSEVATASRQIWSFARDRGLPFSDFLGFVTPGWNIPVNSVAVCIAITTALSFINIGSEVALNAISSLSQISILSSYMMTIACLIWRRIWGDPLPPRQWSLGRWGLPINIIGLLVMCPIWFFSVWPLFQPPTLASMNWSSVMFVGTLICSGLFYYVKARHEYIGPVRLVKRDV